MERILLTTVIVLSFVLQSWGQEEYFDLSFDEDSILVYDLKPHQKRIIEIGITGKFLTKEMDIIVGNTFSDLSKNSQFNLSFDQKEVATLSMDTTEVRFTEKLYLTIEIDSLLKKDKILVFELAALNSSGNEMRVNIGERKKIQIKLKKGSKDEPLENYKFLSYIGTNFDLVEGVKAENLFFATNIFVEPAKNKKNFGIYLSLYGNRTTSTSEEFENDISTEIVPVTADSSYRLQKNVTITKTTTSDNLGAHFSTLHPIFGSRNKTQGEFKTYFTASTDFIFQRTHVLTEYEVNEIDTSKTTSIGRHVILNPLENRRTSFSQFNFNIGPGIFFLMENDKVSVRIHLSAGYTSIYMLDSKQEDQVLSEEMHDVYFAGRAWITEPTTGITLQAEVLNRFVNPTPSYVVTLSKAFQLEKLAGIFAPITSR